MTNERKKFPVDLDPFPRLKHGFDRKLSDYHLQHPRFVRTKLHPGFLFCERHTTMRRRTLVHALDLE